MGRGPGPPKKVEEQLGSFLDGEGPPPEEWVRVLEVGESLVDYLRLEVMLQYEGAWPFYRRWRQMQQVKARKTTPSEGARRFGADSPATPGATKVFCPDSPDDYEGEEDHDVAA